MAVRFESRKLLGVSGFFVYAAAAMSVCSPGSCLRAWSGKDWSGRGARVFYGVKNTGREGAERKPRKAWVSKIFCEHRQFFIIFETF